MVDEIAKAVVSVDSTSSVAAAKDLDNLAAAGGRAQHALDGLGKTDAELAAQQRNASAETQRYTKYVNESMAAVRAQAAAEAAATEVKKRGTAATAAAGAGASKAAKGHHELSLASGQVVREYAVLVNELQRGDLTRFQGSVITLANRMGLVPLLFSAAGLAVAAFVGIVGAFAVAAAKGAAEQTAFNKTIQATGDFAHTSFGEMRDLAKGMETASVSIGTAKEALTTVTASGRFFRSEIKQVAQGVIDMARVTGQSIDDAAKSFIKLKDDPLGALQELDKSMHFLTESTETQIRTLLEHGQKQEAAALAEKTLADAVRTRAQEVEESLGYLQRAWDFVATHASKAWDEMMGLGRDKSMDEKIAEVTGRLKAQQAALRVASGQDDMMSGKQNVSDWLTADLTTMFSGSHNATVELNKTTAELNKLKKLRGDTADQATAADAEEKLNQKYRDATKAIEERDLSYNRAKQREAEINKIDEQFNTARNLHPNDARFSETEQMRQIAEAEKRYRDRTERKEPMSQAAKDAKKYASEQAAEYERVTKQIDQYSARQKLAAESTDKLTDVQRYASDILANFATGHTKLTKAQQATVKASLEEIVATDQLAQKQKVANDILEASANIQERMAASSEARARDAAREIRDIGHGGDQNDQCHEFRAQHGQAAADRLELTKRARRENALGTQEYLDGIQQIDDAERDLSEKEKGYYAQRKAAIGDWRNGARKAIDDIYAKSQDVAGSTYDGWMNAYSQLEDAATSWSTKTKQEWQDVGKTILAELLKIELRILLSKILSSFFGGTADNGSAGYADYSAGGDGGTAFGTGSYGRGAAFAGGLEVMAKGHVTHGPELFPMANGRGLRGESGFEGVMPLKRNAHGQLGVIASGGQSGGVGDVTVNVSVASDGSSSTNTSSDEDNKNAKTVGQLLGKKIKDVLVDEMKPGGIIWRAQHG